MSSATVVPIQQPADSEPLPTGFDAFWTLYPRHVAKKDARRAWDRIPAAEHDAILTALVGWRRVWLRRAEIEYIPHPATWLNGERWTDELPQPIAQSTSAAHIAFEPTKPAQKGGYSPEVAAALRAALGKR